MKVLKNTKQKNFRIDNGFYTQCQLDELENAKIIDRPFADSELLKDIAEYQVHYVVYTDDCTDIKIEYNKESGFYETVAITKTGHKLHVVV